MMIAAADATLRSEPSCGGGLSSGPLRIPPEPPADRAASMNSIDPTRGFKESIAEVERTLIVKTLEAARGKRSRAATILKIQRRLLYAKMQEPGLGNQLPPALTRESIAT